ncbi:translation initiation factor IF-2 associated domain-containing protein, partial [Tianweitania sp.]|uniref:translation initiation factor IF-2 associated domain-containing protein n=1 Tax=Tianweitania sp. TaxID=2021634 RepID=UPI00289C2510
MTDTKDDKTLTVTPKKTLTLKRPGIEQGTVRQNFSHGRTKSVVVETKKRKFSAPGEREAAPVIIPTPSAPKPAVTVAPPPNVERTPRPAPTVRPASDRGGVVLNSLSRGEM